MNSRFNKPEYEKSQNVGAIIDFSQIPDKLFIPAVMVRDIIRARPLTRAEKSHIKRGGPDIFVASTVGGKTIQSRDEIAKNYTYLNGKHINIKGWQSSKMYILYRINNESVMVLQVPLNNRVSVNGIIANNGNRKYGDYIICKLNESGGIDRDSASVVSAHMFHKICYIPLNDAIRRSRYRRTKYRYCNLNPNTRSTNNYELNEPRETSSATFEQPCTLISAEDTTQMHKCARDNKTEQRNPTINTVKNSNKASKVKFMVVGVMMNNCGQRVGFFIKDASGKIHTSNNNNTTKLCLDKKIGNMTVVENGAGGYYFRGVGISIEKLPIKYV